MKKLLRPSVLVVGALVLGILVGYLLSAATGNGPSSAAAADAKGPAADRKPAKPARSPSDAKSSSASQPRQVSKPREAAARPRPKQVIRLGSVVGLNRETVDEYVILHRHVWPEILERIRKSNIRNYSIYMGELNDGQLYLFAYMEYVGDDFEADMQAVADDPISREWWELTDPLQTRIKNTPTGSQWKQLTEVFHTD
jgi:L-rhamnose mutarotase